VHVKSAVLCTGYLARSVVDLLGASYRGLPLIYSEESSPLGTGGALRQALPHLRSDPVLVLNGDSYCRADLSTFLEWHCSAKSAASLLLVEVPHTGRFGRVEVNGGGAIVRFAEKAAECSPGWINAGVYLLSQAFLQSLPERTPLSLEQDVFPSFVGRGLSGDCAPGWFIDIGTPESYAEAQRVFAAQGLT
ncbi:MAG: galactokinase, partial [Planctomycetes bacterium]|nr:galactokinase [Planctomycetota bacterium]